MEDCIFCKVVSGELPSRKLYEDDQVIAFLDLFPSVEGHTLVVPKAHAENFFESGEEDLTAVMRAVRALAPKIEQAVGAQGLNISTNKGTVAGQSVFHTHVHILPRKEGDGRGLWGKMDPVPDLDALHEKIKAAL